MTNGLRALWIGPCLAASLAVGVVAGVPQNPNEKHLIVTVLAEDSGPAQTLSAADFVLQEDKKAREVVGAELAVSPISIVLLVDTSQPPMGGAVAMIAQDLRRATTTFVKTVLGASPDAQIAIVEFAGAAVTRVPFTSKAAELEGVTAKLYPDTRGTAVMLEALTDASLKLAQQPPPRRAIVAIDFNSPETSAEKQQKQVIDAVQKSGATVWSVSVGSGGSNNIRENMLNGVTKNLGGMRETIIDTSSLEGRLKRIANTLMSQYELTYVRPNGVSSVKEITIETKKGGKVFRTAWMR